MRTATLSAFLVLFSLVSLQAEWETKGDTLIVKTFTFDSITTRSGTFLFPPEGTRYEKILMKYTLKCDPATTQDIYPCGEWDYLTYTYVQDSSGKYDSTKFTWPNFKVKGITPDVYHYSNETVYSTYVDKQPYRKITGVTEEKKIDIFPADPIIHSIAALPGASVNYLLITKEQLDAADVKPGNISGIALETQTENMSFTNLRLRIAKTVLDNFETPDFSMQLPKEVYRKNTEFGSTGAHNIYFTEDYAWDGNSNLVIELSYDHCTPDDAKLKAIGLSGMRYIHGNNDGAYLNFTSGDYIEVDPSVFDGLGDEITIEMMIYGDPAKQPRDNFLFEGTNAQGQRVLNAHLPWGNGSVYWDAGNSGGNIDRIEKAATKEDYAGKWNYWTFTKNRKTGDMRIYLNGKLWHSATEQRTLGFDKIAKFKIGSSADGNGSYEGKIDNISIWRKDIGEAVIASRHSESYLEYVAGNKEDLLLHFDFDGWNEILTNRADDKPAGTLIGMPGYFPIMAKDYMSWKRTGNKGPFLSFLQGTYSSEKDTIDNSYALPEAAQTVFLYEYESPDKVLPVEELPSFISMVMTPTDTLYVHPAERYSYTYDNTGKKIDSAYIPAQHTLSKDFITWYSPVVDYELERFITPYGKGLDLGSDGFTWTYDVSDFSLLLHDKVRLSSGNQQELLDLTFYMVKGIPARDVVDIDVLWPSGGNYSDVVTNKIMAPVDVKLNPEAKMFKARIIASGHGFAGPADTDNCAEFCSRLHSLWLNGSKKFEWAGWKECGDNPVYPQGGTWLIDRTDWCPGAGVNVYHHELTGMAQPGDNITLDYEIENPPQFKPYGNWVFTGYLVSYGDPNFTNDAELRDIISPSKEDIHGRFNPICGSPVIKIRNNGKSPLTQLTVNYELEGRKSHQYVWTGNLGFLEESTIHLPPLDVNDTENKPTAKFIVELTNPNGVQDEHTANDRGSSEFVQPVIYTSPVIMNLRTNKEANLQYSYILKEADGTVVTQKALGSLQSEKDYKEEFVLENGCYDFEFTNVLGYGLSFWFLADQLGSGAINMQSPGTVTQFNPDFGNNIRHQFIVGNKPEIQADLSQVNFGIVETGNYEERKVTVSPRNSKGILLEDLDIPLGAPKGFSIISPEIPAEGLFISEGESREITVRFQPVDDKPKSSNLIISSNDYKSGSLSIKLVGNDPSASVESTSLPQIRMTHTGSITEVQMTQTGISRIEEIFIVNLLGQRVLSVAGEQAAGGSAVYYFDNEKLRNNSYFLIVRSTQGISSLPMMLVE